MKGAIMPSEFVIQSRAREALDAYLGDASRIGIDVLDVHHISTLFGKDTCIASIRLYSEDGDDDDEITSYLIEDDTVEEEIRVSLLKPKKTQTYEYFDVFTLEGIGNA